jgi:nitroreductase
MPAGGGMAPGRASADGLASHPAVQAPADAFTGQDALAFLAQRYSVGPRHLRGPAPSAAQLQQAAALALRAPDHGGLRPFRFVRVDDAQRETLATLFARDAARRGQGSAEVEQARQRARNGPALVALVGRIRSDVPEVPAHEQWMCIGAGLMNFLNALHLQGFAAKTLSGGSVADPDIRRAFCTDGEQLLAWVAAGTPARAAHARAADDAAAGLSDWTGAPSDVACGEPPVMPAEVRPVRSTG